MVVMVIAGVSLLGMGLLARAWLVARSELQELTMGISDLSTLAGGASNDGTVAGTDETGGVASVKQKLEADHLLATLQGAVVEQMQAEAEKLTARIKILESKVARGESALRREKKAHGSAKKKLASAQKKIITLGRQLDARLREIRTIQMKLKRGG
jgi:hypothetical protein